MVEASCDRRCNSATSIGTTFVGEAHAVSHDESVTSGRKHPQPIEERPQAAHRVASRESRPRRAKNTAGASGGLRPPSASTKTPCSSRSLRTSATRKPATTSSWHAASSIGKREIVSGKMSTACCSGGAAGSNGPAVAPRTPYHKDRGAFGPRRPLTRSLHRRRRNEGIADARESRRCSWPPSLPASQVPLCPARRRFAAMAPDKPEEFSVIRVAKKPFKEA